MNNVAKDFTAFQKKKINKQYNLFFIEEGDDCSSTMLLGAPATEECDSKADLHCDSATRQCVKSKQGFVLMTFYKTC